MANGEKRAAGAPPIKPAIEEAPPSPARRAWARLIRKVYEVDPLLCPACRGLMKVISFITDEDVIYRILDHLDLLEPDPPPPPPPRGDLCEAALAEVALKGAFESRGRCEGFET